MLFSLTSLIHLLPCVAAVVQRPVFQNRRDFATTADQQALVELAHSKLRLISTGSDVEPRWVLEEDKDALRRLGIRFMDITDHEDLGLLNSKLSSTTVKHPFPKKLRQSKTVGEVISKLDKGNMHTNLALLTGFHTRYYKSMQGAASGEFLYNLVLNITSVSNQSIPVTQFKHPWGQHSVIARIQGTESNDTIVIGAHQDSANLFLPNILAAPGADDDGSGTVTTLEVLRVLAATNFRPKNTIEFAYFSAEEGGLLGSQAVFQAYEKQGVNVIAMLQQVRTFEMTLAQITDSHART